MDHPESSACQHRDRKFGHHRHVERDPVTCLQTGLVLKQCSELIHPDIELLIRNRHMRFVHWFRDIDQSSFILVLVEMPIDAIKAGIDLATDKPLPARSFARVECRMPVLVPGEEISVFLVALWEIVKAKPIKNFGIRHIRLGDKTWLRMKIFFLLPVDSDLCFADSPNILFTHRVVLPYKRGAAAEESSPKPRRFLRSKCAFLPIPRRKRYRLRTESCTSYRRDCV